MYPLTVPTTPYTSSYCEENVYLLAQKFLEDPHVVQDWEIFAVFISNHTKTVALWNQKLAKEPRCPVVWDYHVVLLLRPQDQMLLQPSESHRQTDIITSVSYRQSWIYDFDTQLELPCTLKDYLEGTFTDVPLQFESLFRIIPSELFLKHFASDRSHMLVVEAGTSTSESDQVYISPPPSYKPICGNGAIERGVSNNLMTSFVSMVPSEETYGDVLDRNTFAMWN